MHSYYAWIFASNRPISLRTVQTTELRWRSSWWKFEAPRWACFYPFYNFQKYQVRHEIWKGSPRARAIYETGWVKIGNFDDFSTNKPPYLRNGVLAFGENYSEICRATHCQRQQNVAQRLYRWYKAQYTPPTPTQLDSFVASASAVCIGLKCYGVPLFIGVTRRGSVKPVNCIHTHSNLIHAVHWYRK